MCVSELHDYRFWQFAWFECSMSAKLCTNLGGQKPTVLGTQFPISSSANKVHSRTHARALVCMPDSTNSSFLLCHLGNTWHIAKSGQVMFQCIRELARLQPGFCFFFCFLAKEQWMTNLLNMFYRGSPSWPHGLFPHEGGFGLVLLNVRWMSCHTTSHRHGSSIAMVLRPSSRQ